MSSRFEPMASSILSHDVRSLILVQLMGFEGLYWIWEFWLEIFPKLPHPYITEETKLPSPMQMAQFWNSCVSWAHFLLPDCLHRWGRQHSLVATLFATAKTTSKMLRTVWMKQSTIVPFITKNCVSWRHMLSCDQSALRDQAGQVTGSSGEASTRASTVH
jgi:hypothetical protein